MSGVRRDDSRRRSVPTYLLPILLEELEKEEAEEKFYSNTEEVICDLKPFNSRVMTDPKYFWEQTRFTYDNFLILLQKFNFGREFRTLDRDVCPGAFALFVVCSRLAYPGRLLDYEHYYNKDRSATGRIYRSALDHILERKSFLVTMHTCLYKRRVQKHFAERIQSVTEADRIPIFAMIDGTTRKICRPTTGQVLFYSGHKKSHCVRLQGISVPPGLLGSLYGPVEGRRNDRALLRQSSLEDWLKKNASYDDHDEAYYMFGDPAYPRNGQIFASYAKFCSTDNQRQCVKRLNKARVSVEWAFGNVTRYFKKLDFWPNSKLFLGLVDKEYKMAALLANCVLCCTGKNSASNLFSCHPPSFSNIFVIETTAFLSPEERRLLSPTFFPVASLLLPTRSMLTS
mmetsp:Transcript_44445/g.115556  ORF Transcript_44445/g.115556 Transcript_44445/m.115556 type:complete len:399 (-) Transcript_44445:403-1599(-)